VTRPRPRRAIRPPLAVRVARIAVPAALITALGAGVAGAVIPGDGAEVAYPAPASTASNALPLSAPRARTQEVSRHIARAPIRNEAAPRPTSSASETITPVLKLKITSSKYATTELNVRTKPQDDAHVVGVVKAGMKLSVTSTVTDGFRYVSYHHKGRWVKDEYLADKKPTSGSAGGSGGISGAPCPSGSSMESGLTPDAIRVHRALCHRYPQISSFLGRRTSSGYHGQGRAVDNMISDSTIGWEIARWVRANAKELGAMEVIYRQHIWTVQRSSEGWRSMSDRGSPTANHMDHVHVSVYGNRGTA
jgi:SH3 domain-containing protein